MTLSLEAVTDVAQQLRGQKVLPLWAVADSGTILAIAKGEDVVYGPRGRWVNAMFKVVGSSWLGLMALRAISVGCVTLWWMKSLAFAKSEVQAKELFIGFGAGPEAEMFKRFRAECDRSVQHLDQTKPANLAIIARPPLVRLWCLSWTEPQRVVSGLRHSNCPYLKNHVTPWLTAAGIKIATYVFFKAWAEYLPQNIRRIVFISPDIPAHAVLDVIKPQQNIAVEFWQHGLLRKSVLVPKFDKVMTLNEPERLYIQVTTGCEQVKIAKVQTENHFLERRPVLLFASIYDFAGFSKSDHLDLLNEVFAWAAVNAMQIIVRLHPCESEAFWVSNFPEAEIDRMGGGFEECLTRVSPSLIMSWFSTALIDALRFGVVPALLMPGSEKALADIVFPLDRIAVKWPGEQALLEDILADQGLYNDQLRFRQQEAFGVSGCRD